jgi:hypothetical protein
MDVTLLSIVSGLVCSDIASAGKHVVITISVKLMIMQKAAKIAWIRFCIDRKYSVFNSFMV